MACIYVYGESKAAREAAKDSYFKNPKLDIGGVNNYDSALVSDNIWQIRDRIYDKVKQKLTRYNDYSEDTKEKLKDIRKKASGKSGSGQYSTVTKIVEGMVYESKITDTKREETLDNLVRGFGSGFHSVLEKVRNGENQDAAVDIFIQELNALKQKYDLTSETLSGEPIVQFLQNFDSNIFRADVNQAILDFNSNEIIEGCEFESELPIKSQAYSPISGKIDLCAYDKNGNFKIIDFKTSSTKSGISSKKELCNYLQLEMYKRLLMQNNIQWDRVSTYIVDFKFDETGHFRLSGITDASTLGSATLQGRYNTRLNDYIPVNLKPISTESEQKLVEETNSITESLFTTQRLKRKNKENFKEFIEKCIANEYIYTLSKTNQKVKLSRVGDKIYIENANTGEAIEGYDNLTFEEFVNKEIQDTYNKEENVFSLFTDALSSRNKNKLKQLLRRDSENSERLIRNLGKYTNSNWEYQQTPLEQFGIITMVNRSNPDNKYVEFIQLTSDLSTEENLRSPVKLTNGELLLDDVLSEDQKKKYVGYDKLPLATIGNVRLLEAMIRIGQFNSLFDENTKIANITVLSTIDGSATQTFDFNNFETALKILQAESRTDWKDGKRFGNVFSNFEKFKKADFIERTTVKIIEALRTLSEEEYANISLPDDFSTRNVNAKIKSLEKLEGDLEYYLKDHGEFDTLEQRKKEGYRPSPKMDLYMTIGQLINNLRNIPTSESMTVSQKAFTFRDSLIAGAQLLIEGKMRQYTPDGMLVTGLAQGLMTSTAYTSPDENVQRVNLAIDTYYSVLRAQFIKEIEEINAASIKFLKWNEQSLMFGRLQDQLLGYHTQAYMTLLQKDPKTGKLDRLFRFINPYTSNNLVKEQKEFLEVILWHINRYRMHGISDTVRNKTYEELKKDAYFETYKQNINKDSKWLNVPIKAGSSVRLAVQGAHDVFVGDKNITEYFSNLWDRAKEAYDPKYLTRVQTDKKKRAEQDLTTFNYYDEGGSRTARLNKQLPSEFELNLNYLCNDYVFCSIKQKIENNLLRTVDRQISGLLLYESATGQSVQNQVKAIIDRTKVSIYNDNLIDEEYKNLASLIGIGKAIGSYTKIALRPMLYAKELLAGRIRNLSALAADYIYNGDKITTKDMMEAAALVFGEGMFFDKSDKLLGNKHAGEFSLIDSINNLYAITDRDINIYSERLSADRFGFFNVGTRTLYQNTVRPDWFNRMIIFVAKMKADGTFDAHKLDENNQLVYSMKDDKRFDEYYKHRNEKNYTSENFRKQKALYEAMMDDFIAAGFTKADGTLLQKGDDLPQAYTPRERNSIKEQIGALYGYYDHEEKALVQSGTWYNLFMQFVTYLPGDVKRWFNTGKNSSVGSYVHLKDEQGNLLYVYQDALGLDVVTTDKNANRGNVLPYTKWEGHQVEGLAISLFKTAHDLCTLDFKHLQENPQQYKNAMLALFQLIFASLIGTFFLMLFTDGSGKKKDMERENAVLYDLITKAANDITFYNSVVQPVIGINFAGQSYFSDIVGDTFKALSNENYQMMNAMYDNLSIMKDTHLMD